MMDIQKLNEQLDKYIEAFQINEMAIYYGTDRGTVNNVMEGYKKLFESREGMYHINQTLNVSKTVTQDEIDKGLFKPIQKGILITRQYPIIMVWGEMDKRKGRVHLEGHGLSHILQGHNEQVPKLFTELNKQLNNNKLARYDNNGNYVIKLGPYRFSFMLENNEDGTPKHAVLISAFFK